MATVETFHRLDSCNDGVRCRLFRMEMDFTESIRKGHRVGVLSDGCVDILLHGHPRDTRVAYVDSVSFVPF